MSVSSSRNQPPSAPSTSSLNIPNSSRASRRPPPPLAKVVTSPPWARDEPPSPTEDKEGTPTDNHQFRSTQPTPADSVSFQTKPEDAARWWTFTLPRVRDTSYSDLRSNSPSSQRPIGRRRLRDRSISWLQSSTSAKDVAGTSRKEKDGEPGDDLSRPMPTHPNRFGHTIDPLLPSTTDHTSTPGWDVPWSARLAAQGPRAQYSLDSESDAEEVVSTGQSRVGWAARRKLVRSFILNNNYVPLLFRLINIAFTAAALAMAVHIRQVELDHDAMGAVGSSPTVVIIIAPLTLLHVMAAVWLEYFGRPLGLWRTSAKLAHTLSEVLFICAWSASLSLCFDNFFTSLIPCASPSNLSWYNKLPRPQMNIPIGTEICQSQLALICLVGVGLIAYCTNLIISLYRIFEKVKVARSQVG